ncbi:zinc-binding dehydrogenase [Mesorhizobium sp. M1C.F.Ca.ET.188.01.1.1]|uniref:zinc-binding dehydrogenase n=1 Tax=Mesorhizobium sp. M1C.F.Ca.ET.188.01.1.1 TaxID=2563924 RepID=UPI001FE0EE4D|nr:zinc-binding dehydrogenase [Mesorhizobium sp. M1C.F.Ca.ET.188.01.1.1]
MRQLIYKDLQLTGATIVPPGTAKRLVALVEQGLLKPLLAAQYPLRELGRAQQAFMDKQHVGNIVVTTQ